jgi:hypothetical protein
MDQTEAIRLLQPGNGSCLVISEDRAPRGAIPPARKRTRGPEAPDRSRNVDLPEALIRKSLERTQGNQNPGDAAPRHQPRRAPLEDEEVPLAGSGRININEPPSPGKEPSAPFCGMSSPAT